MQTTHHVPASILRQAEALAREHVYFPDDITSVHVNDAGELSAVGLGVDADGMALFALNFDL